MTNQEIYEKATGKPFNTNESGYLDVILTNEDMISLKELVLSLPENEQDEFILFMLDGYSLIEDTPETRKEMGELYPNLVERFSDTLFGNKEKKTSFEKFLASPEFGPNRYRIFETLKDDDYDGDWPTAEESDEDNES